VGGLKRVRVAAAVLAGGRGRRMGREKATLPVGGTALALRVAAVAAEVADPVVLVAPAGHPAHTLGLPVVADPGDGPLAAVAAALAALAAEHVLVLGGDHPALQPRLLELLVARRAAGDVVACDHDGRLQTMVAVYRRATALAAASALLTAGERSLRALAGALDVHVVAEAEWRPLDPAGRSFADVDEPGDLRTWRGAEPV
jgi:molybdopterin-guanine dinucleotide biosynthesis protein A